MTRRLKNVTVTLDEPTARWARIEAARRDTSLSRYLGDLLRREMTRGPEYEAARASYMSKKPLIHRRPGQPMPSRDELYDRDGLR